MRFTITPDDLHFGLNQVIAAIPSRTVAPILANVLIEATDQGVHITGFNYQLELRSRVTADVQQPGSLAVPARKLFDIVRPLPADVVYVNVDGQTLNLRCGKARFTLNGVAASEYPTFPSIDFDSGLSLPVVTLAAMTNAVSYAVSTNENRPILTGVLWELGDDVMTMVATAGHRLACCDLINPGP